MSIFALDLIEFTPQHICGTEHLDFKGRKRNRGDVSKYFFFKVPQVPKSLESSFSHYSDCYVSKPTAEKFLDDSSFNKHTCVHQQQFIFEIYFFKKKGEDTNIYRRNQWNELRINVDTEGKKAQVFQEAVLLLDICKFRNNRTLIVGSIVPCDLMDEMKELNEKNMFLYLKNVLHNTY